MKTGTQKLVYQIEDILYQNHIINGKRRIARQIVEAVEEWIGDDMSKKDFDLAYGFPQELNPVVRQLESGLGIVMMRDAAAIEIYKWLAEQGKEKINKFIQWATATERVQYVGKYRRSPGLIRTEWKLVTSNTTEQRTSMLETITNE